MAALTFARPARSDIPVPQNVAPTLPENSEGFEATVKEIIDRANKVGDEIVARNLPEVRLKFDDVIEPLANWANWAALKWFPIACAKEFSPSKKVVEDATTAEVLYNQGYVQFLMRYDVWEAIEAYNHRPNRRADNLTMVQKRLINRENRLRMDLGLSLEDEVDRARLTQIETDVRNLSSRYYTAIKDRDLGIWFTPDELDGVTSEFLQAYTRDEDTGKYFVPFTIENIFNLTRLAHNPETRERILCDDANKWEKTKIPLEDGTEITVMEAFRRVIQLKAEAAQLKGFDNNAAAQAYRTLLEDVDSVRDFIAQFADALSGPAKQHVSDLLEFKVRDHEDRGIVTDDTNVLYHWDNLYYIGLLDKERKQIDREVVREYFPVEHVVPKVLDWIEEKFGLIICDLPAEATAGPWDPSVRLFGVWKTGDSAEFVGYLYLDLFDRENKQNQASVETLQPAITVGGEKYLPTVILPLDLKRPAEGWPALMYRSNLNALFQNIPGAIARLLGTSSGYAELNAAQSRYTELNSVLGKVFSRLAGNCEMLRALSKHYSYISPEYKSLWLSQKQDQDDSLPNETIPLDLATRIEEDLYAGQAQANLRQIRYAKFDLDINSCANPEDLQTLDLQKLYMKATADIVPTKGRESKPNTDQTDPESWRVIGHAYLGIPQFLSSAGKGFQWMYSEAISEHLYQVIFPDGPFGEGIKDRFVDRFLSVAGTVDLFNAYEEIMDEDISPEPFFKRVSTATS